MAVELENRLNIIGHSILKAQKFDSDNRNNDEASQKIQSYKLYIESMRDLFQTLSDDLTNQCSEINVPGRDLSYLKSHHSQILKTSLFCIERSLEKIDSKPISSVLNKTNRTASVSFPLTRSNSPSMPRNSMDVLLAERAPNPVDAAKYKIQKLIQNTNKAMNSSHMTPSQKATMQLRLRREIENTLNIARKQETLECSTKTNALEQFLETIQEQIDKCPTLKNNHDLRDIFKNSQLFYYHILKDSKWFNLILKGRNPGEECLRFIIRIDNHPITEYLNKHIQNLVSIKNRDFNKTKESIDSFNRLIHDLSIICYIIINSNIGPDNEQLELDKISLFFIEYAFNNSLLVTFIYNYLFESLMDEMKQYNDNLDYLDKHNCKDKILPEKIRKIPQIVEILKKESSNLVNIRNIYNPFEKISCLCKFIQDLLNKIQKNHANLEVGGDELMPILTFICIECDTFEVYLHARYIELLIPEDYLMGMEGYVLTSMRCALEFCVSETLRDKIDI